MSKHRRRSAHSVGTLVVWTFAARLVALVLTAFVYIVAARRLGATNFGTASAVVGAVTVFSVFADAGTANHVLRDLAQGGTRTSAGAAFRWRLNAGAILLVISTIVSGVLAWKHASLAQTLFPLALAIWISALSIESLATAMRIGLGRPIASAGIAMADRFAALIALTAMTATGHRSALSMCAALVAGATTGCVVGGRELMSAAKASGRPNGALRFAKESVGFLWSGVGAQLQNVDVTVVGLIAGSGAAGILAAPSRLTTPIGVAAASAASIVLAQARYTRPGEHRTTSPVARVTGGVFGLTIVGTCPLWAFPTMTARVVLGAQYTSAAAVLRVVAVGTCIAAINQPLAAHLQAQLRQRYVGVTVLLGGVIGIALVAALARHYGAMGGGIAIVTSQCVVLAMLLRAMQFRGRGAVSPVEELDQALLSAEVADSTSATTLR